MPGGGQSAKAQVTNGEHLIVGQQKVVAGQHAGVRGVTRLSGARVRAPDIRAGVALVLAGLVAEGETTVTGAHHISRGYQDLVGDLRALGAKVTSQ